MRFSATPALQGFNPNTSIIRVGTSYYMSSVSSDWRRGIQIFQSYDLKNWILIKQNRDNLVPLGRIFDSKLTYHKRGFCLLYKIMEAGNIKRTYFTSAQSITGKWSDPIVVSNSGHDASTYYDRDGSTWILKVLPPQETFPFSSIIMHEYDGNKNKLKETAHILVMESDQKCLHHPLLFLKNNYFHLLISDDSNQTCILRSKYLKGPYVECRNEVIMLHDGQTTSEQTLERTIEGTWFLSFDDRLKRPYVGVDSRLESALQTRDGNIILRWSNRMFNKS